MHRAMKWLLNMGTPAEEKHTGWNHLWGKERGATWEQAMVGRIKEELMEREMQVFVIITSSGPTMLLLFALLLNYSNALHDILPMCKWANYSHFLW